MSSNISVKNYPRDKIFFFREIQKLIEDKKISFRLALKIKKKKNKILEVKQIYLRDP